MNIKRAVHPLTLRMAEQIEEFLSHVGKHPDLDHVEEAFYAMVPYRTLAEYRGFFTLALLTREGAEYFLDAADRHAALFTPNQDEGAEYQVPEIVLSHVPELREADELAREIARRVLWPIFHCIYGNPPNTFSSVQLARYAAPSNLGTGWHADTDSEATCVVSLAPDRHVGGGTLLRPRGAFGPAVRLQPLPKGTALLFNGRTTLHRGVELESGERNLLVYWMKNC